MVNINQKSLILKDAASVDSNAGIEPFSVELQGINNALATLDDAQLALVLAQLPADQLSRAFQNVLLALNVTTQTDESEVATSQDARCSLRQRTLRAGRIIFNNSMSSADCEIRDISETGCRIKVESPLGIPERFILQFLNGNAKRECEVKWRKTVEMGLIFAD